MDKKQGDTNFKENLINGLKKKNLSESSIKLYVNNLDKLNDHKPLKNLKCLEDIKKVEEIIEKYKPNTKRNFLIMICSILSSIENKNKKMTKLYEDYYNKLIDINKTLKEKEKNNEMSETQKNNWIEWEEVNNKLKELKERIETYKKKINESQFNVLLSYLVLSLFVYIPPRRNLDYMKMKVVNNFNENFDDNYNYYDLKNKKFIFNKFKTAKKEGQQLIDVPEDLQSVINKYLSFLPKIPKEGILLLQKYNGQPLTNTNAITLILNKIFGPDKKVSSSMLRHIYLSSKYGKVQEEMKKDAKAMSHDVNMQKDYIKTK